MDKKGEIQMKNINWRVRFSKDNILFWIRFIIGVITPALAYLALEPQDLSTWQGLTDFLMSVVSNPYLLALTVVNAVNLIPDPTSKGLGDTQRVLSRKSVNESK